MALFDVFFFVKNPFWRSRDRDHRSYTALVFFARAFVSRSDRVRGPLQGGSRGQVVFRVHSVQATSNVVSSASIPGRLSFFTRVPEPHGNGWAIRAARPAAGVFLFSARRASGDARLDKNPSAFSQNVVTVAFVKSSTWALSSPTKWRKSRIFVFRRLFGSF